MAVRLYDSAGNEEKEKEAGANIVSGIVVNNCDLINEAKVLVRIPSLDQEVWARLAGTGGGSGAGFFYNPRVDDEVLVAIGAGGPDNAYIIAGLWNTDDTPPVSSIVEAQSKRVLKTGLKGGIGHEVEFDDAQQSITITSSTKQKVTIGVDTIELKNSLGTLTVTLDNLSQTITVKGVNVTVEANAILTLKGKAIQISGEAMEINSKGPCTVSGKPISLN